MSSEFMAIANLITEEGSTVFLFNFLKIGRWGSPKDNEGRKRGK